MPSIFGHTLAGLGVSAAYTGGRPPRRVLAVATACALAPDLDWFTGFLDVHDRFGLAHRGLNHSLAAAALITVAAVRLGFRGRPRSARLWLCMATATFSHLLLDACTFGGTGVALFQPFSDARFVAEWQPLFVSPIPLSGRLLDWLLLSLRTEALWIGVPALLVWAAARAFGAGPIGVPAEAAD